MFTVPTLNLLATLLGQVQLSAGAADFDEQAAVIGQARKELLDALDAAGAGPKPPSRQVRRAAERKSGKAPAEPKEGS